MLFILMLFSTIYKEGPEEFKLMIASYVVYVNLFNSFCGAKMNSKWNKDVSNSYVYIFDNVHSISATEMDLKEVTKKLKKLEMDFIIQHVDEMKFDDELLFYANQEISNKMSKEVLDKKMNINKNKKLINDMLGQITNIIAIVESKFDAMRDAITPETLNDAGEKECFDGVYLRTHIISSSVSNDLQTLFQNNIQHQQHRCTHIDDDMK